MSHFKRNLKIYFLLFLLLVNFFIYYLVLNSSPDTLKVAFLDVGQGDAALITAPGGEQMLIDGGPDNSVLRELGQVIPFYDRSIDVVVASHPDQDHIGGLVEVLKRYKVDLFIESNTTSTSAVYLELENLIKEKNIRKEIIMAPERLTLGENTEFDILFPNQNTAGWETNDASIVGKLVYGNNSFLFTGDSPLAVEKYIVGKYGPFLKSDVLKVGHHGSKNSSSELFVGTVLPKYAVISAGLNNKYGHPTQIVLDILSRFGAEILKTMGNGRVVFESNSQDLKLNSVK